ncbi:concanavalin A-like lectin/glucanase domain-containing protein, partial [Dactylonectria macrodidyma]
MAPSLLSVGAAALACVGSVSAKQWYLHDTYDATNFFDNFDFFSDADPNSGHVVYKTQEEATSLGIAKYDNDEVYLGVDYTNVLDSETGRPSVRLHSKEEFNHGLFIARFSHLPEPKCGAWPAFWSVGNTWPDDGEIDLIEGWNLATNNKPAFHTGDSDEFGTCMLDGENQSATVDTDNCDNTYQNTPDQYLNEGCTADDYDAPYGNSDGGVYALEWTDSYIKVFAWKWANVPDNLDSDEPDTDSWGTPSLYLKNDQCTIDDHFVDQTLIINIAFCGNPVGNDDIWAEACKAETSYDTCSEYVSAEASAFENTYFKIQDIRYFK